LIALATLDWNALQEVFERSGKIRVETAGYPRRDRIRFERYVSFD